MTEIVWSNAEVTEVDNVFNTVRLRVGADGHKHRILFDVPDASAFRGTAVAKKTVRVGIAVPETPADAIRRVEARAPFSFALDEAEGKRASAWCDEHDKKHPRGDGAIGGRYTYLFAPTTLGTVAKMTCACGESVDLTNYEEW